MAIAYKYKLDLTQQQRKVFNYCFYMMRKFYNIALEAKNESNKISVIRRKQITRKQADVDFSQLIYFPVTSKLNVKNGEIQFIRSEVDFNNWITWFINEKENKRFKDIGNVTMLRMVALGILKGFDNYYAGNTDKPQKKKYNASFQLRPSKIDFDAHRINLGKTFGTKKNKLGSVKFFPNNTKNERLFDTNEFDILFVTIKKDNCNDYWISITVEKKGVEKRKKKATKAKTTKNIDKTNAIGIDLGRKTLCVMYATKQHDLSQSEYPKFTQHGDFIKVENPKFLEKSIERLQILERKLSKCEKGSNNFKKIKLQIAKLSRHIEWQREDYANKIAKTLCEHYDVICIETLDVQQMIDQNTENKQDNKRYKNNRGQYDAAFGTLITKLHEQAKKHNKTVVQIEQTYPSSQLCHHCGYKYSAVKTQRLSKWTCPNCKKGPHDRDENAAINILNRGLQILDNIA